MKVVIRNVRGNYKSGADKYGLEALKYGLAFEVDNKARLLASQARSLMRSIRQRLLSSIN